MLVNYLPANFAKTSLFLANWSCFGCSERLPGCRLVAFFRNCTSSLDTVLFLLSFLFKRVTPMILIFMFLTLRSRADSNRCRRFCRPLPSHSATRPFYKAAKIANIYCIPTLFKGFAAYFCTKYGRSHANVQ